MTITLRLLLITGGSLVALSSVSAQPPYPGSYPGFYQGYPGYYSPYDNPPPYWRQEQQSWNPPINRGYRLPPANFEAPPRGMPPEEREPRAMYPRHQMYHNQDWGYPSPYRGYPNPYTGGYGTAPWTSPWNAPPPFAFPPYGGMPPMGYAPPYPNSGYGFSPMQANSPNICH